MNRQPSATDESNQVDMAATGPSLSSPASTTACTAKIVEGRTRSSSFLDDDANALSTNEKVSGEGQPATGTQQHDQGQVQDALSKAAIIDQLASAAESNQSLSHSINPHQADDAGNNKISAFRPRKKEIHFLSDVFLRDFRDLLASDLDSDSDSDDDNDAC